MTEIYSGNTEVELEDKAIEVMHETPAHEQVTDDLDTMAKYVEDKFGGNE